LAGNRSQWQQSHIARTIVTDIIGAAFEAAISRVLDAKRQPILDALAKSAAVPPADEPDRFVRMSEVKDLIGLSPSSIWRLERAGRMPARERMGGSVGYRMSTIKAILASLSTDTPTPPKSAIKSGEIRRRKVPAASN
jgi:predicted DNA-binding transcriptional regulator AlpA